MGWFAGLAGSLEGTVICVVDDTGPIVREARVASGPAVLNETGPWALFRLFDKGEVRRQGGPELYAVTWRLGERTATFELRANSVQNPLIPNLLRGFQCPVIQ